MADADTTESPAATFREAPIGELLPTDFERRVPEYWSWIAVALFLLVTVDLLTTTFAVHRLGLAAEGNPVVRWLIRQGTLAFVGAQLLAVVVAAGTFQAVIEVLRRASPELRTRLALVLEVWIAGLVSFGLFLLANNVSAIVFRSSLL